MTIRFQLLATALTLALATSAAFAAPGHGGGHNHGVPYGEPGDTKAKAREIHVTMTDEMRFLPASIMVSRGETIRFVVKNAGALRHEMTLGTMAELLEHAKVMEQHPEMEHDDPNAVTVEPGMSKTMLWKFTKAGSFDFGCLVPGHMPAGMKGRIIVR